LSLASSLGWWVAMVPQPSNSQSNNSINSRDGGWVYNVGAHACDVLVLFVLL
jgi:hypothetical protein